MPQIHNARRQEAFERLNISRPQLILSIDGGGMRGILSIQLLKRLEEQAGIPCYELFDMVSGTSTGGIIASLIAIGYNAIEIEALYDRLVPKVFQKRSFASDRFLNPPKYTKENFRALLKKVLGDISLEEAVRAKDVDLMITAKDMSAAEETFFSCFKMREGGYHGTYKDVLLRAVVEATMSAPTYFHPLERFVDGGITTYNNPSIAAIMEATTFSRGDQNYSRSYYKPGEITVFSFGNGISRQFLDPRNTVNPEGVDLKFWLEWLMIELGQDASAMQVDAMRSQTMRQTVDYRRYQISFDPNMLRKLPNCNGLNKAKYGCEWLHELDELTLKTIDMADVDRYDLVKLIGQQMGEYILQDNRFRSDLVNEKGTRDELISTFGDIARIREQMKDPGWLDNFTA